jgi:hypothetical protein
MSACTEPRSGWAGDGWDGAGRKGMTEEAR